MEPVNDYFTERKVTQVLFLHFCFARLSQTCACQCSHDHVPAVTDVVCLNAPLSHTLFHTAIFHQGTLCFYSLPELSDIHAMTDFLYQLKKISSVLFHDLDNTVLCGRTHWYIRNSPYQETTETDSWP